MNIIDKRRREKWDITLWATEGSVIVQICLPEEDGRRNESGPIVDVACRDFQTAVMFARSVCRRTPRAVDAAAGFVFNWAKTSPETFIALLHANQRQRR
jgi:hypothetical protein